MKKFLFLLVLLYGGLVSAHELDSLNLAGRTYCQAAYATSAESGSATRFSSVSSEYGSSGYLLFTSPEKGVLVYSEGYYNGHAGNYEIVLSFSYAIEGNIITLTSTAHGTSDSNWKEFRSGTFRGYFLDNSIYLQLGSTNMLFISIDR